MKSPITFDQIQKTNGHDAAVGARCGLLQALFLALLCLVQGASCLSASGSNDQAYSNDNKNDKIPFLEEEYEGRRSLVSRQKGGRVPILAVTMSTVRKGSETAFWELRPTILNLVSSEPGVRRFWERDVLVRSTDSDGGGGDAGQLRTVQFTEYVSDARRVKAEGALDQYTLFVDYEATLLQTDTFIVVRDETTTLSTRPLGPIPRRPKAVMEIQVRRMDFANEAKPKGRKFASMLRKALTGLERQQGVVRTFTWKGSSEGQPFDVVDTHLVFVVYRSIKWYQRIMEEPQKRPKAVARFLNQYPPEFSLVTVDAEYKEE